MIKNKIPNAGQFRPHHAYAHTVTVVTSGTFAAQHNYKRSGQLATTVKLTLVLVGTLGRNNAWSTSVHLLSDFQLIRPRTHKCVLSNSLWFLITSFYARENVLNDPFEVLNKPQKKTDFLGSPRCQAPHNQTSTRYR